MNNSKIVKFWSQTLIFQIEKSLEISKFFNLDDSKNFKFGNPEKFAICQIKKKINLDNSKKFQFESI